MLLSRATISYAEISAVALKLTRTLAFYLKEPEIFLGKFDAWLIGYKSLRITFPINHNLMEFMDATEYEYAFIS